MRVVRVVRVVEVLGVKRALVIMHTMWAIRFVSVITRVVLELFGLGGLLTLTITSTSTSLTTPITPNIRTT